MSSFSPFSILLLTVTPTLLSMTKHVLVLNFHINGIRHSHSVALASGSFYLQRDLKWVEVTGLGDYWMWGRQTPKGFGNV